jgi:predicted negative regulator of RcsB-dependent stress response
MVDDILLTPEEQDERAKQWLKDNGMALILGVVLGLGAVFGYQTYQTKIRTDAEQASFLYNQVLESVRSSELADISDVVTTLKNDYAGSPYAAKATLLRAKQLAVSNLDQAAEELRWVADGAKDIGIRHTARIRLAKVLLADGKIEAAKAVAEQKPYEGFESNYAEILGDIAAREQEFEKAREQYETAITALSPADRGYSAILELKLNRLPVATESESSVENTVVTEEDVSSSESAADSSEAENVSSSESAADSSEAENVSTGTE